MFKNLLLSLVLLSSLLLGEVVANVEDEAAKRTPGEIEAQKQITIAQYLTVIDEIELKISEEDVWMKAYSTYLTSLDVAENR